MTLLTLPAELRLRIYDFIPNLQDGQDWPIVSGRELTPALSRTNRLLRNETLPLFAHRAQFAIPLDEGRGPHSDGCDSMAVWIDGLNGYSDKLKTIQMSRHWEIKQPSRWEMHCGFYLRLQQYTMAGGWVCTVGTYPLVRDNRGMRLESVELLRRLVVAHLNGWRRTDGKGSSSSVMPPKLSAADLQLFKHAMGVVAEHPISTFDLSQDQSGRQTRRGIFEAMELKLWDLFDSDESCGGHTVYAPC